MVKLHLAILFILVSLSSVGKAQAQTYNAADDFSHAINPNGAWSYGFSSSLGGFTPYTGSGIFLGNATLPAWLGAAPGNVALDPWVTKNVSNTMQTGLGLQLAPGDLAFHPGPQGQYSIVRWTAPTAGDFSVGGLFESGDRFVGSTVDVHVLENGSSLLSTNLVGPLGTQTSPFSFLRTLNIGDTIDFAVGFGPNSNFGSDSTVLDATITTRPLSPPASVPEPSSLFGLGCLGAFVYWQQRRTS